MWIRVRPGLLSSLIFPEQKEPLASRIWQHIKELAGDHHLHFVWVPSHCGVLGNEDADRLAGEATEEDQTNVPTPYSVVKASIARASRERLMRTRKGGKCEDWWIATGGKELDATKLSRWEECTVRQLRCGRSSLTRAGLFKANIVKDPFCRDCGEPNIEDVRHLLLDCPYWTVARERTWGHNATIEDALRDPKRVVRFLRGVGRVEPPLDPVSIPQERGDEA